MCVIVLLLEQVATSLAALGVRRQMKKHENMHGKNIGDAMSDIPSTVYKSATLSGKLVDASSHLIVLFFADTHREPSTEGQETRLVGR